MNLNKVFFSYSRMDASEFTLKLALDLKKEGFNVWIDQEDIRAGTEWDLEIEKALETCDCLLFIESEKSVSSHNVLDEVYYALEQKKRVIPIIYHDSKTPFRIQRLQHIDFSKNYDEGLPDLIKELKRDCREQVFKQEENIAAIMPAKSFLKKYAVLLSVLATALLFTIAWFIFNNNKEEKISQAPPNAPALIKDTQATILDEPAAIIAAEEIKPVIKENNKKITTTNNRKINTTAEKIIPGPATTSTYMAEYFAGNWVLADVEPKTRLHRGYLKIEALDEKKVKLLSNMQFYYFKKNSLSYLSVFNAFASCNSCKLQEGMKIIERDVAIGINKFEVLTADNTYGKKGDTVMSGGGNTSISAYVYLYLIDKNTIHIKIEQSNPTPVDNGLIVPPFVYTFRFKKK
jgi:hypothetical protein